MTPTDRAVIARLIHSVRLADQAIQANVDNIRAMKSYATENPALESIAFSLIQQDQDDICALFATVLSEARVAVDALKHVPDLSTEITSGDNQ